MYNKRMRYLSLISCFALGLLFAVSAQAAELLMVEEAGCVFCKKFNDEIAPAYPNTTEGKLAPLRRIDLANGWPDDLSTIEPETLTPTFILVENNQELGRLYGYQGDEFFWYLLGELLEKLDTETTESKP